MIGDDYGDHMRKVEQDERICEVSGAKLPPQGLTELEQEMLEALKAARGLIEALGANNPEHPDKFNGVWASYRDHFDDAIARAEARKS